MDQVTVFLSLGTTLLEALELTFRMAWETWWALVLGFTLAGAIEAFVSEKQMTRTLGGRGWKEVGLGTLFGAASSSCSYSAVSTSKTLFKKGASGVASLGAFMFASTNLVIELGLVIWVLLGWQFVVGEYIGGIIVVILLVISFKHVVPTRWFEDARAHLHKMEEAECAACGMTVDTPADEGITQHFDGDLEQFCCGGCLSAYESQVERSEDRSWLETISSVQGWKTAARTTIKEWDMLWVDIAIGFVLAGFVGAFVPASWWEALFSAEGTFSLVVLNTAIAVLIGVLTFMCSVGNVPFALVLWTNGLPFGSVLAFVYADMIIPPLTNLYRKYYGWRLATVLFSALFLAAVLAGVVVHYLMGGLGLIPVQGEVGGHVSGEFTTALNLLFTPVFLGQVYLTYGPNRLEQWIWNVPTRLERVLNQVKESGEIVDAGVRELLRSFDEASDQTDEALASFRSGFDELGVALRLLWQGIRKLKRRLWESYRAIRDGLRME